MTLNKPNQGNPSYEIPQSFSATNPKQPFTSQELTDGYGSTGLLGKKPTAKHWSFLIDFVYKWLGTFNKAILFNDSNPEGQVIADIGAICLDYVNGKIYIKESGTGNTGWKKIYSEGAVFTEDVQDTVGGMVTGNTENGIAVTYDDATGKLNFDVNDPVITLTGDVSGSATITNLGDTSISVTVDKVDGKHASDFVQKVGDTITGNLTIDKNTPAFYLDTDSGGGSALIYFNENAVNKVATGYSPVADIGYFKNLTSNDMLILPDGGGIQYSPDGNTTKYDIYHTGNINPVSKAGDTMTGNLTIPDGTASGHAVNKGQLDNIIITGSGSPEGIKTSTIIGQLYVDTSNKLLYMKTTSSGNTGWVDVTGKQKRTITKTAHGFNNDFVYCGTDSQWYKAIANDSTKLATHFAVNKDANNFDVYILGDFALNSMTDVDGNALVAGEYYYLSNTVAGKVTKTAPNIDAQQVVLKCNSDYFSLEISDATQIGREINGYPIGAIYAWSFDTLPAGAVWANGSVLSRIDYSELFDKVVADNKLGSFYGAGDGSTTFTVPNLNGRFLVGAGSASGLTTKTIGQIGGEESHVLTIAEMPSHAHDIKYTGNAPATGGTVPNLGGTGSVDTTELTGGDQAHNTMPPYVAIKWVIQAKNVTGSDPAVFEGNAQTLNGLNGSSYLTKTEFATTSRKNFIINGDMRIAQRCPLGSGKTLTGVATPTWVADRFYGYASGYTTLSAGTIKQISGENGFDYALKYEGVTFVGASSGIRTTQKIESLNAIYLKNKVISISADFYQDTGSVVNVNLTSTNATAKDNYASANNTINADQSLPSGVKTRLKFEGLSIGDCSNGSAISFFVTMGACTTKNLYISNIQVEIGNKCTDFEYRPYGEELILCQRYFERQGGASGYPRAHTYASATSVVVIYVFPYAVRKRTTPTLTKNGTWTVSNCSQPVIGTFNDQGYNLNATSTGAFMTAINADAPTSYVDIDAEI